MAAAPEIPVHVGQRLRAKNRQWVVREVLTLLRTADQAQHWYIVRLDFTTASGGGGSVVLSSQEFDALARQAEL